MYTIQYTYITNNKILTSGVGQCCYMITDHTEYFCSYRSVRVSLWALATHYMMLFCDIHSHSLCHINYLSIVTQRTQVCPLAHL